MAHTGIRRQEICADQGIKNRNRRDKEIHLKQDDNVKPL